MEDYPPLKVRVLGSGTSTGVPVIGCDCPVCTSDDPHNKRLRSSIKIEVNGTTILVDCGVDFRQQILTYPSKRIDAVLVTHTHADHVHGIDDLRAFCFRQREHIPIYTTARFIEDIKIRFAYCFNPLQMGGGIPMLDLEEIKPGEIFKLRGVPILPIEIMHGKLPILGFRMGKFAYLTDCSAIPDESHELLEGVETIILSALRERPHPTHFNIEQAVEASEKMKIKKVYFIHMTCSVDHGPTEEKLPEWARLAYDGLEIEIA